MCTKTFLQEAQICYKSHCFKTVVSEVLQKPVLQLCDPSTVNLLYYVKFCYYFCYYFAIISKTSGNIRQQQHF